MEPRLTGIDRQEALRYLGVRGDRPPADVAASLDKWEAALLKTARPRAVWRLFDLMPDGTLAGTTFRPAGEDIRRHLTGCDRVVLMAATLGAEADVLLRRTQVEDMAQAVILDAAAGAAVENVCDDLCAGLAAELAPAFLTGRFSPGYGDMPLEQQGEMCRVLDTARRIGVGLTPGGLMTPMKSVTALIGVSDTPREEGGGGCKNCAQYENCGIRKAGGSCGR